VAKSEAKSDIIKLMFYRRRFLGGLLQIFGGRLSNVDLQKYLMLATDMQNKPLYEFTPYKYGCFSFTSYCDKRAMTKSGMIKSSDGWVVSRDIDYFSELSPEDQSILIEVKNNYGNMTRDELVQHVYKKFSYYTINSEIADKFLTTDEINRNKNLYYSLRSPEVFSIGYEGKSTEGFINALIKNNIKILVDVRKNPISMKYGFSKSQLKNNLDYFNISYIHIPELGIVSDKRKELKSINDYRALFDEYEKTTLANSDRYLWQILRLWHSYKRICLMCFEADPDMCHRTRILKKLVDKKAIELYTDLE